MMPTVTAIAAHLTGWCRIEGRLSLDEVEVLGVDAVGGHGHGAQGILHSILQGTGTTDEVLQGLIPRREPPAQRFDADEPAVTAPVRLGIGHHVPDSEIQFGCQLPDFLAEAASPRLLTP